MAHLNKPEFAACLPFVAKIVYVLTIISCNTPNKGDIHEYPRCGRQSY